MTILHVSDLHIGDIDPETGDARYSGPATRVLSNFTYFDGVLGHHARALQDLQAYAAGPAAAGESPLLVVSGDVTRVGHGDEFAAANRFLAAEVDLNPPNGNNVGLGCGDWRRAAIPGNHDHWPGAPTIFGRPTQALAEYFPPDRSPFIDDYRLANDRVLQLIGINTDAGVSPYGQQRLRAVGDFGRQLSAAAPRLGPRRPEQIRALLMHHSWHHHGFTLGISQSSRDALNNFLVDHGIQVLLTGHTHRPLVQSFVPPVPQGQPALECRSGTTTQHDEVPYKWKTLFGMFPDRKWPENSLLLHRLSAEENGTTFWEAETFIRLRGQGFVSLGPRGKGGLTV